MHFQNGLIEIVKELSHCSCNDIYIDNDFATTTFQILQEVIHTTDFTRIRN